ncbi:hypothetical protein AB5J55_35260 [Streptomyces sp. R11]|uniref:Uncharacterized protein n=1 Tax=Streptomyces sp. R11 TaxID=3238625 RepID=A0AB39N7W6_9ACTN
MAKRQKKTNPNDVDELQLTVDPFTGLPALTVVPRTTPIPEKKSRRGRRSR